MFLNIILHGMYEEIISEEIAFERQNRSQAFKNVGQEWAK